MCELDHEESWGLKSWCFWTVVLEKTAESPLDCKLIKPVNPKENKSWVFIGRVDAEAPILWPPDVKNWLIGKDPDAGKYWKQEEKGTTKDEMVGWHHWLNGHEFEQAPGFGDGQGSLVCCSPWGRKESDMTEQLNWPDLKERGDSCWFIHSQVGLCISSWMKQSSSTPFGHSLIQSLSLKILNFCELKVYGIHSSILKIPTWTKNVINSNRDFSLTCLTPWSDLTWSDLNSFEHLLCARGGTVGLVLSI